MVIVLNVNSENPESETIEIAVKIIKNGGLIVYPTDTIYGLGANALNLKSVVKVFIAKNRPLDQALPLIVSGLEMAEELAFITEKANKLISFFWPGALTIILEKKPIVPSIVTGDKFNIGLRSPNHAVPLMISKVSGLPLTATSANKHGGADPIEVNDILNQLGEHVDMILDGGKTEIGTSSTVIDLTRSPPLIIRKGPIKKENIERVIGTVET